MKLLPLRLVPIFQRLEQVFLKLDAGEYDRQRATAMATVAGVLIKIVQAGEFEERLRIIEQQVGISGRDRDRYGNAKEGPIQWPTHTASHAIVVVWAATKCSHPWARASTFYNGMTRHGMSEPSCKHTGNNWWAR
jgi:hypothetical protein